MPDITLSVWLKQSLRYLKQIILSNTTDPNSRATAITQTFSGDDVTTAFTLTYYPDYFTTVTIGATAKYFFTDYYNDFHSKTITFDEAPAAGTNNISVTYYYTGQGANTDSCWLTTSFPLTITEYPFIAVTHIGSSRKYSGIPRIMDITSTYQIDVWDTGGTAKKDVDDIMQQIDYALRSNDEAMSCNGLTGYSMVDMVDNDATAGEKERRKTMRVSYTIKDTG